MRTLFIFAVFFGSFGSLVSFAESETQRSPWRLGAAIGMGDLPLDANAPLANFQLNFSFIATLENRFTPDFGFRGYAGINGTINEDRPNPVVGAELLFMPGRFFLGSSYTVLEMGFLAGASNLMSIEGQRRFTPHAGFAFNTAFGPYIWHMASLRINSGGNLMFEGGMVFHI